MTQERFEKIAAILHNLDDGGADFIDAELCQELFDYCLTLRKQVFDLTKDAGIPYKGDDDGA